VLHAGAARACTDRGWLCKLHSFATDAPGGPTAPRLGPLRVLDEIRLDPGEGEVARRHQDVEILIWVLEGALEHQDSAGNLAVVEPGELARLRAGHGVRHSAYNASGEEPVRLLEIWIQPATRGLAPDFEARRLRPEEWRGVLRLIASPDGAEDSLPLAQAARLYAGRFAAGEHGQLAGIAGHAYYAHCTRGALTVNGCALAAGDALELHGVDGIDVHGEGELLLLKVAAT
jgi:redox-sensitive bicupin YhaK (pirin superfamily)